MKCPRCSAWSQVLSTRAKDEGHLLVRRRLCANGHRFTTSEIHQAVFCSAKQRQRDFLQTVLRRSAIHQRNAQIRYLLKQGVPGSEAARRVGVSTSTVSLVNRNKAP